MNCLNLSQENGIQSGVLYSTLNLGDFHRTMGNYSKAYDYLSRSLDIASSQGMIREEALLLERLSWLSRDKKDFEAAYEYQLQSTAISDSLRSEQVQRDVAELTLQYETEKKEKELSLLKVKSQRQLLIIGVGVVCLLILVIGVLWTWLRNKKVELHLAKLRLQNQELFQTLNTKELELTKLATQLVRLQEQKALEQKTSGGSDRTDSEWQIRNRKIDHQISLLDQDFEARIMDGNKDFFATLLKQHPSLSLTELQLCALIRLGLSNKEIAALQNKSIRTVEALRYSIRKKMGLNIKDDLSTHLILKAEPDAME